MVFVEDKRVLWRTRGDAFGEFAERGQVIEVFVPVVAPDLVLGGDEGGIYAEGSEFGSEDREVREDARGRGDFTAMNPRRSHHRPAFPNWHVPSRYLQDALRVCLAARDEYSSDLDDEDPPTVALKGVCEVQNLDYPEDGPLNSGTYEIARGLYDAMSY